MTKQLVRVLTVIACAWMMVLVATPAQAQNGNLKGRVVDEAGKPVADVEITLDFVGDYVRQFKIKTDTKGMWIKAGMPSGGGVWTLTAVKGDLTGQLKGVRVMIGEMTTVADITIKAGGVKNAETAKLSNDEIEKRNKKQKELEQLFTDANTAIEAGNLRRSHHEAHADDDRDADVRAVLREARRHLRQEERPRRTPRRRTSRRSRSIRSRPDAYNALATIYNAQKKFDDAAKMSAKANELQGASGDRRRRRDGASTTRASSSGTRARSRKPRRSSRRPSSSIRRWPTRSTGSAWRS